MMEFEDIERILELVRAHDLAEFELEREGLKLRVRKNSVGAPHVVPAPLAAAPLAPSVLRYVANASVDASSVECASVYEAVA